MVGGSWASVLTRGTFGSSRVGAPAGTALVIVPVTLAGCAVVALALAAGVGELFGAPAALLAAAAVAELFPVPIEGVAAGETSFAGIFIAATGVLYGWRAAAIAGALTMLLVELQRRRPLARVVYNSSLYVLAGAAAGIAAQPLNGRLGSGLIGAAGFYAVDVALLSAVVARVSGDRYLSVARSFYVSTLAPFVVMAGTTAVFVRLWRDSHWAALLLLPPLVAIVMYQRSLVAAVERQRELDQLKDEFMAVTSHELRTPVASVYGSALTLERPELDAETRERLMTIIRRESARLSKLVDDVLWASRLDTKRLTGQHVSCNPAELVREVVSGQAELAPTNIEVAVVLDPALPEALFADGDQVRRVLLNLLENAVKYSPDGGSVLVSAQLRHDAVRFTVTDEGLGVPDQERERIFEKFIRLDPQMTRGIGGTGLGLYISRELVRQMGGAIWVAANDGGGSSFMFEIPAKATRGGRDDASESTAAARARRGAGRRRRRLEVA